jgi:hypothetical protein
MEVTRDQQVQTDGTICNENEHAVNRECNAGNRNVIMVKVKGKVFLVNATNS